MAEPHKLPSGRWRIQWLDAYGTRESGTFASQSAARAAQRHREVERDNIRSGVARPRSDQTLREVAATWIEERKPAPGSAPDVMRRRNQRVRNNLSHLTNHILPRLGDRRLPEITAEVVQKFIRQLEATPTARHGEINQGDDGETLRRLSAGTIATVIITLRKLMNDAGYPIRISYQVPETDFGWIKASGDVAKLLEVADPPWFRMSCELAVYAGLRLGEVAGLLWDRVDMERGLLQIDRSYEGPTKSKHVRAVPLAPELAERLKRWRLATGAIGRGRVVTIAGEPLNEHERRDMAIRTRRACKAAGIEAVTFHQLRHTFASHLAERVALPIVGAVLGHADPKTTARYAHVDTASMARDPRLHLQFGTSPGKVIQIPSGGAHAVHTATRASGDDNDKQLEFL